MWYWRKCVLYCSTLWLFRSRTRYVTNNDCNCKRVQVASYWYFHLDNYIYNNCPLLYEQVIYSKTLVSGMTPNWLVLLLNIELSLKLWRTQRMQDSIKTATTLYSGKQRSNFYLLNRRLNKDMIYKNDIVFGYIYTTLQSRNVETFRRKRSPSKQDVCRPTSRREIDHDWLLLGG